VDSLAASPPKAVGVRSMPYSHTTPAPTGSFLSEEQRRALDAALAEKAQGTSSEDWGRPGRRPACRVTPIRVRFVKHHLRKQADDSAGKDGAAYVEASTT